MDKNAILALLLAVLGDEADQITKSLDYHRDAAIEAEGRMVSRYDSTKAEMSYLADGHQTRLMETNRLISTLRSLGTIGPKTKVEIGALVQIKTPERIKHFLILPGGGGRIITVDGVNVTVISPISPLYKSMRGLEEGEEFDHNSKTHTIVSLN
jgi:hypothetical protein